jgi:anti-sigma-K factor RskA
MKQKLPLKAKIEALGAYYRAPDRNLELWARISKQTYFSLGLPPPKSKEALYQCLYAWRAQVERRIQTDPHIRAILREEGFQIREG